MNSNKISKAEYLEWVAKKIKQAGNWGIDVNREEMNAALKPHQKDAVWWAATGGRRAVFANFGLGKTWIQLELCREFAAKAQREYDSVKQAADWEGINRCLIVCPLNVVDEFMEVSPILGVPVEYVKNRYEVLHTECQVLITNYERVRDGDISFDDFVYVTLDEASAIRSVGSKTFRELTAKCADLKYKSVCTATPAPNDYIEILNYAEFLGIMDISQAKTRWFKRNSEKADELTVMPGKEKEFWLWVFSWALFIKDPSSLGHDAREYILPGYDLHVHVIPDEPAATIDATGNVNKDYVADSGQGLLMKKPVKGLSAAARHKRDSVQMRVEKAVQIIECDGPLESTEGKHWILWHHLERERVAIEDIFKGKEGFVSVYGSQTVEEKRDGLRGFAHGKYRWLATKPDIAAQGNNFQKYCADAIYVGINEKFNDFIQSIHRILRFQQVNKVNIHLVLMESEQPILDNLMRKWKEHDELITLMDSMLREYGLTNVAAYEQLRRTLGVERIEEVGKGWTCVLNDTVLEHMELPDDFFGLQFSSWPFAKQYEYSASYHDLGHNATNEECFEQLDFLIPNLYRTLQPGRLSVVHAKERIIFGNFSGLGFPTVYEFPDEVVRAMKKYGFQYCGRVTIACDVVRENNQTYRLGHTENGKDSTKMSVGLNEYALIFRKPQTDRSRGYADERVTKNIDDDMLDDFYSLGRWQIDAAGTWRSSGDRLLTPEEYAGMTLKHAMSALKREQLATVYDYERHVEIADAMERAGILPTDFAAVDIHTNHPDIWDDIVRMRGMNTLQGQRGKEQHLCPLPFDVTKRVINRWSNKGDRVGDCFGGMGTVPYIAEELEREGWACELNYGYWDTSVGYMREKEAKRNIPTLFDLIKEKK